MRKPVTHAVRNAETRRRLLASARRIFLKKGFHAASLADVAKDAGYTKGAVFSQFESKANLFLALLEQRSAERLAHLQSMQSARSGISQQTPAQQTLAQQTLAQQTRRETATSLAQWVTADWRDKVSGDRAWTLLVIEFRVYAARDANVGRRYAALHDKTCATMASLYTRVFNDAGLEAVIDHDTAARLVLGVSAGILLEQDAKPDLDVDGILEAIAHGMLRRHEKKESV